MFQEAIGIIDAKAGTGKIDIDDTLLNAMRGIRFDHQNGTVQIAGSTITAPLLSTGGKGSGKTSIKGGTTLKSAGTQIDIGRGASIEISGDAEIRQN